MTRTATPETHLCTYKFEVQTEEISSNGNIQMDKDLIEGLDASFSQLSLEEKD